MAKSYKELSDELNRIVEQLQAGDLSLDEAVKQYEAGMKVVQKLEAEIKTAENTITKIKASMTASDQ